MADTIRAAVIGVSGYGGAGVLGCLLSHPRVEVVWAGSNTYAGKPLAEACPWLRGLTDLVCRREDREATIEAADVIFMAAPKGVAMEWAPRIIDAEKTVIDLSGDFRFRDPRVYEEWYGIPHTAPDLCGTAVYGIPELARERLVGARLIANSGCYPIGPILGLTPLLAEGLIEPDGIVVDAKSGVSGAGRAKHELLYHFPELNESVTAYRIGSHQHTPEIEAAIALHSGKPVTLTFTPHLIPITRGILSTIYARAAERATAEACRGVLSDWYGEERYIRLLPPGLVPSTKATFGSNLCDLAVFHDRRTSRIVLVAAIDNLTRGASTQAVQNLNVALGFEESLGLPAVPVFP
jgi:N-acetyl-gamma-glutamyl-phosphate reductase